MLPLIGIATAKTSKQEHTWCGHPFDGRAAHRTKGRAHPRNRITHALNFPIRPPAKPMPLRVIGAAQFLAFAADRAVRQQIVIAAVELTQFELERPSIVRTSNPSVFPKLFDDPVRLFW